MNIIYFDNAATSWPKPYEMIRAMNGFNNSIGANPGRSGHRLSIEASRKVFDAREAVAGLIGADDPLSIVFTRNATESLNTVINGLLHPGDHVITSGMEHNSVMRPLRELEKAGIELSVIGCSGSGELDPGDIIGAIKKNTKLVLITHASNVTGAIMPVAEIGKTAKEKDILFCVDAAQTAGNFPVNVINDNIDILVFTGHKSLYGPQGTGGFYLRKGLEKILKPHERGGTGSRSESEEQPDFLPDKYESGTPNTIGLAGLCAGIGYVLQKGVDAVRRHEMELTKRFIDGLQGIKRATVYGSPNAEKRTSVVSFNIAGMSPSDLSFDLDEKYSIMSRPGLHCSPSAHKTIGTFPDGTVRFSFGNFNTIEQIDAALEAVSVLGAKAGK